VNRRSTCPDESAVVMMIKYNEATLRNFGHGRREVFGRTIRKAKRMSRAIMVASAFTSRPRTPHG